MRVQVSRRSSEYRPVECQPQACFSELGSDPSDRRVRVPDFKRSFPNNIDVAVDAVAMTQTPISASYHDKHSRRKEATTSADAGKRRNPDEC